ncbi:MAG TPA: hypothetical protein VGM88_33390 [Kofleriaceae bacterium]
MHVRIRMRWLLLCLMGATAAAAPNGLPPRGAHAVDGTLIRIDKAGEGLPPEDADEATYRYDLYKDRDPAQKVSEAKTRRMLEQNDRIRDNLLVMKPGEVRWLWFSEQDGMLCSHFGCEHGPDDYAAKLELVSVTRHADTLPDDMHITAWPYLGVRRGKTWAPLPAEQMKSLESVRIAGDNVVIEDHEVRFGIGGSGAEDPTFHATHSVSLASLRARLDDADGLVALRAKKWKAARDLFARAVALDASLDLPQLHLAAAQAHLREASIDLSVLQRDPAGLYWRVMADDTLAVLRTSPAIRALVAKTPGTLEAIDYRCASSCMEIDPSGRFVVAYASVVSDAEFQLSFGVLRVIDLKTREVISTISLDDGGGEPKEPDGTQRCVKCKRLTAAQKTLTDLGFTPVKSAPVTIALLDARTYSSRPLITFPDAKLQLGRAGDKQPNPDTFLEIKPPVRFARVPAAELFDSLVIYRWTSGETTDVTLVPR